MLVPGGRGHFCFCIFVFCICICIFVFDWLPFAEVECLHARSAANAKSARRLFQFRRLLAPGRGKIWGFFLPSKIFLAPGLGESLPVAKLADNDQISPENVPPVVELWSWVRICSICVKVLLSHYSSKGGHMKTSIARRKIIQFF